MAGEIFLFSVFKLAESRWLGGDRTPASWVALTYSAMVANTGKNLELLLDRCLAPFFFF